MVNLLSLSTSVTALTIFSRTGEQGESDDQEIIDLVEEGEEEKGNECADQVTETETAQSELGKKPVFHHEIYDRLVNLMSRRGSYSMLPILLFEGSTNAITAHEPPDHGIDSKNITSFHPDQRDWSFARAYRAPILTLWSEPLGSAPNYRIGYLLFNGRLMLDYAGKPIKAFRNLPLTISSAVKGFRLETWIRQEIHRLHIDDILARLRTRNTPNGRQPLHRRGDLTDRANAFRLKAGLITFRPRNWAVRLQARAYIDSLRTAAQRANNLATDQDLTPDQLATLKKLSKIGSVSATAAPSASERSAPGTVGAPAKVSTPSPTVTPPSRPTHPPRPCPASQPAPASPLPPAPAQNLQDSRDSKPSTCKESYVLTDALEETVAHFKKLTGRNPKATNPTESYSSQWNALQAQFAPIWELQKPAEETPLLFKLRAWTGGINCWDDWRVKVGGEERDREGEIFGQYMDASQEGTAYLGRDGKWRSVRDTWCNSHANTPESPSAGRESSSEEESESPEHETREIREDTSEETSDDEFDDAE